MDCNLPGSSVHGIFQARILEWDAISFSRDLPNQGSKLLLLHLLYWQADYVPLALLGKPLKRMLLFEKGILSILECYDLLHCPFSA